MSKNNLYKKYFPSKKSRLHMVSWFSPFILLKTLQDLVLSKIVGSQVDTRELQSVNENAHGNANKELACRIKNPYTLNNPDDDFYFDYIADTGDGWDSTYSIASLLSRDYLFLDGEKLPRGEFLVLGGDEVYPGPSEKNYQERLVSPYQHAWDWLWLNKSVDMNSHREMGEFIQLYKTPEIYAIPGNHDWYDSLIAFRKVFCNVFNLNRLGQWKTNQARSYFALELPHDWVILAFDIGLDQYKLDGLQYHYFHNIIDKLSSNKRIILMAAEPQWVYGGVQNKKLNNAYKQFENLITEVFNEKDQTPPKIYLNLAGDTHNYQRYESLEGQALETCIDACATQYNCSEKQVKMLKNMSSKQHKRTQIVAGGGGAFLHPTHSTTQNNMTTIPNHSFSLGDHSKEPFKSEIDVKDMFELKSCYPDIKTSKKMANKLLFSFLLHNFKLGFFIATLYLVLAWPMRAFLDSVIIQKQFNGFADSGLNFLTLVIAAFLITGFTLWARKRPGLGLTIAGFIHGSLQALLLYGGYVIIYLWMSYLWQEHDLVYGWFLFPITRDIVYFIFISIFSPLLLSLALWVYLNYFQANQNDLFGSGSIKDFKHLLRLKIDKDGVLTIYPIAVEKVTTYSMPTDEETSEKHLELLRKYNGQDWNKIPSYAPNKDLQIKPEKLNYRLIEQPIVIKP